MAGYHHYGTVGADWTFVVGEKEKRQKAQKKDEHRTSNIEYLMEKDEETEELIKIFLRVLKPLKRNRNSHSGFDISFLQTNEIILQSGATSLFDVQCWTFDVGCSVRSIFDNQYANFLVAFIRVCNS